MKNVNGGKMIELVRVSRNGASNNVDIARELHKAEIFRFCSLSDVLKTMKSYGHDGLLVVTENEIILNHMI